METLTVREKLRKIVADKASVDDVKDDANFGDDLGVDSLDAVELVMAVEEAFGIDIPDEDAERLTTFLGLLHYLEEKGFKPDDAAPGEPKR